jgi:predicted transcriptional regulator
LRRLGPRRSHLQNFFEILDLCRKPQVKTRIMYRANLSYRSLQHYLTHLQKYELLERHHSEETYLTTEKGLKFLQRLAELQQLLAASPKLILYSRKSKIRFIGETE